MRVREILPEAINTARFGPELYKRLSVLLPVERRNNPEILVIKNLFNKFNSIIVSWLAEQSWNQEPEKYKIVKYTQSLPSDHKKEILSFTYPLTSWASNLDAAAVYTHMDTNIHYIKLPIIFFNDTIFKRILRSESKYQYTYLKNFISIFIHELTHFIQDINAPLHSGNYGSTSLMTSKKIRDSDPNDLKYYGSQIEITARANQLALAALRELKKTYLSNSNKLDSKDIIQTLRNINSLHSNSFSFYSNPPASWASTDPEVQQQYQKKVRQRLLKQAYLIIMNTIENHKEYIKSYFDASWGTNEEKDNYDTLSYIFKT